MGNPDLNLFSMVGKLSSAARMPLPGAMSAATVDSIARGANARRFGASIACGRTGVKRVGIFMIVVTASKLRLRCKPGIQSRANEDQDGGGQEDDRIVET